MKYCECFVMQCYEIMGAELWLFFDNCVNIKIFVLGPPPPPPAAFQNGTESPPIPVEKKEVKTEGDEPIYEAVIPREEPLPVCVSPPPLPTPPRICSESPKPTQHLTRSNSSGVVSVLCNKFIKRFTATHQIVVVLDGNWFQRKCNVPFVSEAWFY